jgi:hypothetical protein
MLEKALQYIDIENEADNQQQRLDDIFTAEANIDIEREANNQQQRLDGHLAP